MGSIYRFLLAHGIEISCDTQVDHIEKKRMAIASSSKGRKNRWTAPTSLVLRAAPVPNGSARNVNSWDLT